MISDLYVAVGFLGFSLGFWLWDIYWSPKAVRRDNPHLWDFSDVVFWKDMTKEQFLETYPLYPNGMMHTGFIVNFEDDKSYKVVSISALTNSGIRSIAFNKKSVARAFSHE